MMAGLNLACGFRAVVRYSACFWTGIFKLMQHFPARDTERWICRLLIVLNLQVGNRMLELT